MARGIKKKDGEKLDAENLERVIQLLNAEKPISKKAACEMLNITYNTTRLASIISEYEDRKVYVAERRKQLRGKELSEFEEKSIVESYLNKESISEIAENSYRSAAIIKNTVNKYNIPLRDSSNSYFNPPMLPDTSFADDYTSGNLVYSARYDQPAEIARKIGNNEFGGIYKIWLYQDMMWATQPAYELADLRGAQNKLGIKLHIVPSHEVRQIMADAFSKARRGKND